MISIIIRKLKFYVNRFRDIRRYKNYKKNGNNFDKTVILGEKSYLIKNIWGKHSGCNSNCKIVNTIIGNYVNIAWDVCIGPRSHIYTNFTTHDFIYTRNEFLPVANIGCFEGYFNKIGNDVWIGCNAIILPGVEIGNGAVIAAGSIVNKSIPPYAIVGGNPAKFIKWRFTKEQIDKLEELKWYEWEIKKIIENKEILEKIVEFDIDKFKKNYFERRKDISIKE